MPDRLRLLTKLTFTATIMALVAMLSAGPASAMVPSKLRADATTNVNVSKLKGGGAKFSGTMRVTKVKPAVGKGRVPKKMKKGAKAACKKLYAGKGKKGFEPWVRVNQDPRPGLTLNFHAGASFSKSGKWKTSGLHPDNSHSPFTGETVRVLGGFYDANHTGRATLSAKFKFAGKNVEVTCGSFKATYKP